MKALDRHTALIMKILVSFLLLLIASFSIFAQKREEDRQANAPIEPFQIIGNIYYVGAAEVTSFLVVTPKGHILIDAGFAETVPQIIGNIKKLGFKPEDIKIMLNTQAHLDHAGGFAELKKLTGAKLYANPGDKALLEAGGKNDFAFGDRLTYEPVRVDSVISDGEKISLGRITLTAVFTPGHTKGCTLYTYQLKEKDRTYSVAFVGSTTSPGYKFYGNEKYPNIIADFEYTFALMKKLKPDIFLASHGSFFDLLGKADKIRVTRDPNPFIDPESYKTFVADTEKAFKEKLAKEKAAGK